MSMLLLLLQDVIHFFFALAHFSLSLVLPFVLHRPARLLPTASRRAQLAGFLLRHIGANAYTVRQVRVLLWPLWIYGRLYKAYARLTRALVFKSVEIQVVTQRHHLELWPSAASGNAPNAAVPAAAAAYVRRVSPRKKPADNGGGFYHETASSATSHFPPFPKQMRAAPRHHESVVHGEWIMTRRNWKSGARRDIMMYVHGGFFTFFDHVSYRRLTGRLAKLGFNVLSVSYRLAPEHPFPAALEDVIASYLWLIRDLSVDPSEICLAGDSAGANLCVALDTVLMRNKIARPRGLYLISPYLDLSPSLPSLWSNIDLDILTFATNPYLRIVHQYAGDTQSSIDIDSFISLDLVSPVSTVHPGVHMLVQSSPTEQLAHCVDVFVQNQADPQSISTDKCILQHDLFVDTFHVLHFMGCFIRLLRPAVGGGHSSDVAQLALDRAWKWWEEAKSKAMPPQESERLNMSVARSVYSIRQGMVAAVAE
ncbi:hypothetical protein RI367_005388 [Sorochytrium milnesiophthora]